MSKLTPLPVSHATNLYDLLSDVIVAIESEPKRLDLTNWMMHPERAQHFYADDELPSCGTTACIAGWIVILGKGPGWVKDRPESTIADVAYGMFRKFRFGVGQYALFSANIHTNAEAMEKGDIHFDEVGESIDRGDPRYVPAVVAKIRRFQAAFATELRQAPVDQDGRDAVL